MKFAKLFKTVDGGQVLLTVQHNKKDGHHMVVRTDVEHGYLIMTYSFENNKKAVEAMSEFDQSNANTFRNEITDMTDKKT